MIKLVKVDHLVQCVYFYFNMPSFICPPKSPDLCSKAVTAFKQSDILLYLDVEFENHHKNPDSSHVTDYI